MCNFFGNIESEPVIDSFRALLIRVFFKQGICFFKGRRIYGGCKVRSRFFVNVIKTISGVFFLIFQFFRWVEGGFLGTSKGAVHPHNSRSIFSDTKVTASRLNTMYGLETLYNRLDTLKALAKFWDISNICDDVINVVF